MLKKIGSDALSVEQLERVIRERLLGEELRRTPIEMKERERSIKGYIDNLSEKDRRLLSGREEKET